MKITRENANSKQIELYKLMSEISERRWCAGWIIGNEIELWEAVIEWLNVGTEPRDVTYDERDRLAGLSYALDGWWYWPEGSNEPLFVSIPEWGKIYHSGTQRRKDWDEENEDEQL